ncbi:hypothetical protein ACFV0T_38605 [Streptomyces sp. NPDC059582]|uniref:hypothetical protein n=1 Tax=Streptomyces sp. NPDC059582 TaxID=3346875 RepID=UPI003681651F
MPYPPPSRTPSGTRRRSLLTSAAGVALLVGCSTAGEDTEESSGSSPSVAERARARAAQESKGIVEQYDVVIAAHPGLVERLGPLRAEALRHVQAFESDRTTASPSTHSSSASSASSAFTSSNSASASSLSASPGPAGAPSSAASSPAGVGTEKDALAWLATAERTLADQRAKALLDLPGELARLLASVAAAGAAHTYLLTEGAK